MNRYQLQLTRAEPFADKLIFCKRRLARLLPDERASYRNVVHAGIMSLRNIAKDDLFSLVDQLKRMKTMDPVKTKRYIQVERPFEDMAKLVEANASVEWGLRRDNFDFYHYGVLNLAEADDETFVALVQTTIAYEKEAPPLVQ